MITTEQKIEVFEALKNRYNELYDLYLIEYNEKDPFFKNYQLINFYYTQWNLLDSIVKPIAGKDWYKQETIISEDAKFIEERANACQKSLAKFLESAES